MENNYLEIDSNKGNIYDDMSSGDHSFKALIKVIKAVLPKKVTPRELITYLQLIVNDVRNNKCGFNHSQKVSKAYEEVLANFGNIDLILTWIPDWIELISSR